MRKTLTALIAASALLFAACGDDDDGGGGNGGGVLGGGEENSGEENSGLPTDDGGDDSGDEASGGGDAESFCDIVMSASDPSDALGATPPDEIADAWERLMSDPENPDTEAATEVGQWISSNCMEAGEIPDIGS